MTTMAGKYCSVCKQDLECTDFFMISGDEDFVDFVAHGYCPDCGRTYRWIERFIHHRDFEFECTGLGD